MGIDELLSAYLDDGLSQDERAAVERCLAADGAVRASLEAMGHVRASLRSLSAGLPDDMLPDFRRRLDERVTPVLDAPLQDSLRAMQTSLSGIRRSLTSDDRRQRIQRLVEAANGMCPALGGSS